MEEIKSQPLLPLVKTTMMMSLCGEMTTRAASIPSRKRHPFELTGVKEMEFILSKDMKL